MQKSKGYPWPVFLGTSGGDVGKGADEGGELLVGRVEAFWVVEDEHRSDRWTGDVHAKVDDDNVTIGVRGAVENGLEPVRSVNGEREWRALLRSWWTMLWRWRYSTAPSR